MSTIGKTRRGQTDGVSSVTDGLAGPLNRIFWPFVAVNVVLLSALAALVWHSTEAGSVDRQVATTLYAQPGSIGRLLFSSITRLGSPIVAIVGALAIAAWTWHRCRDRLLAALCPVAVASATAAESVTKVLVHRSRPATAAVAHVYGQSFPSGHATVAAALALGIGIVAPTASVHRRRLTGLVLTGYVALIGLSRLVLGVHYLTDVIAGTVLGATTVVVYARLVAHRRP